MNTIGTWESNVESIALNDSYRTDQDHYEAMFVKSPTLRICHLGKYYHPFRGGIETHVRSLAQAQSKLGHDVTVACINHIDSKGDDVWCRRLATTPSVTTDDHGVAVQKFGKFATVARFDFCTGVRRFLKQADKNFDVLHLHVPNPALCVWLASMKPKLPLVVTYHSDIVKQRFIRKPFRIVEDRVLKQVDRIIVATQAYRDSSDILRKYVDRTTVVPFGLDLTSYRNPSAKSLAYAEKLRSQYGDAPLWLCVGRLVYYKGFEHAVRALKHSPGRLMIVGNGPLFTSLQSLATELGVSERVLWRNSLDDDELRGAYLASTALWFPSVVRSEAFGLVQIEAMASGCPVINTDIAGSGVSWVSMDGVSGCTVPIENPMALAEAANRIAMNPAFRARLSAGAIQRAEEIFDIRRMTARTMQVYDSVLSRNTAPVLKPEPQSQNASSQRELLTAERS
jgi:rhamnosyl/mannosyltransferase